MTQADEDSVPEVIGRVLGGTIVVLLGAALTLASVFFYLGGFVFSWIPDWLFLEDFLLVPGAIGFGLMITGFTLIRRTRKRRAAEAAEEAAFAAARAAGVPIDTGVTFTAFATDVASVPPGDYNPNRIPPKKAAGSAGSGTPPRAVL